MRQAQIITPVALIRLIRKIYGANVQLAAILVGLEIAMDQDIYVVIITILLSMIVILVMDVQPVLIVLRKLHFLDMAALMDVMGNVPHAQVELAKLQHVKVCNAIANLDIYAQMGYV